MSFLVPNTGAVSVQAGRLDIFHLSQHRALAGEMQLTICFFRLDHPRCSCLWRATHLLHNSYQQGVIQHYIWMWLTSRASH